MSDDSFDPYEEESSTDSTDSDVKYPHIRVGLIGQDGNAFAILGNVSRAMRKNNVPESEITAFWNEATDGDYNHLLQTCMKWVSVS